MDVSMRTNVKDATADKLKVFYAYTYGSAGWLALQSLPLIISPTIMITLLSPEVREPTR
jgi:hypothetical protein